MASLRDARRAVRRREGFVAQAGLSRMSGQGRSILCCLRAGALHPGRPKPGLPGAPALRQRPSAEWKNLFWSGSPALKRRAIVISPYGAERFGLLRADGLIALRFCVAAQLTKSGSGMGRVRASGEFVVDLRAGSIFFCVAYELRSPATAFGRAEELFFGLVPGAEAPGYCRQPRRGWAFCLASRGDGLTALRFCVAARRSKSGSALGVLSAESPHVKSSRGSIQARSGD
jgi:hypothetical protein